MINETMTKKKKDLLAEKSKRSSGAFRKSRAKMNQPKAMQINMTAGSFVPNAIPIENTAPNIKQIFSQFLLLC